MRFSFFKLLAGLVSGCMPVEREESQFIAIPARPSTSELAEDLLVDPEALKLETHEPGVFDEKGDYVPQYSDNPADLESLIKPFDAPDTSGGADSEPGQSDKVGFDSDSDNSADND